MGVKSGFRPARGETRSSLTLLGSVLSGFVSVSVHCKFFRPVVFILPFACSVEGFSILDIGPPGGSFTTGLYV